LGRCARIDTWLIDYAGAEDNEFVRAVSRPMLVAAVRRIRSPGCKFDEILILQSTTQGFDKSTALATLAVKPEWFTDSIDMGATDKEAIEQLQGKWIVEVAELKGRGKRDPEHGENISIATTRPGASRIRSIADRGAADLRHVRLDQRGAVRGRSHRQPPPVAG
jgi:predicted P-loop ATPase